MNIAYKLLQVKKNLISLKKEDFFLDDFKMIDKCKRILLKEIDTFCYGKESSFKEQVIKKFANFINHNKNKNYSFLFFVFLFIASFLTFISVLEKVFFIPFIFNISMFISIFIIYFSFLNFNSKNKFNSRIDFIIKEAIFELENDLENFIKEELLKPIENNYLEQDEISLLLSDEQDFLDNDNYNDNDSFSSTNSNKKSYFYKRKRYKK